MPDPPAAFLSSRFRWPWCVLRTYSCRVVVPVDSTVAEAYVLRCLTKALTPPHRAEHLTFALRAIVSAQACSRLLHRSAAPGAASDDLLDMLVPILYYKCRPNVLRKRWDQIGGALLGTSGATEANVTHGEDAHGEDAFSACTWQAATHAACRYWPVH